jgi:hypothetical protein
VEKPRPDPATEDWYGESVQELTELNRRAAALFQGGKVDEAAAVVTKGQPLADRLLQAPRPTLAAMEAASDLDDVYGRILLANHNAGWARLVFQKNVVRWKGWKPQTPDAQRRLKKANAAIADCDRAIAGQ